MRKNTSSMRPQDIVILLKKTTSKGRMMNNKDLAASLHISASEVSESLERSRIAHLLNNAKQRVNVLSLLEFLKHGIHYVYPVMPQGLVRGIPTASSAFPMKSLLNSSEEQFVWGYKDGNARGQMIVPLYPSVPDSVQEDDELHELLALVDSMRIGNARERDIAQKELEKKLMTYGNE